MRRQVIKTESGRITLMVSDHAIKAMAARRGLLGRAGASIVDMAAAVWDNGLCRALVKHGQGWLVFEETTESTLCVKTFTPSACKKDHGDLYAMTGAGLRQVTA